LRKKIEGLKPKVNRKLVKTRWNAVKHRFFSKTLPLTFSAKFPLFSSLVAAVSQTLAASDTNSFAHFGPFYDKFPTPDGAVRTEILGPLFGWEVKDSANLFRFTPVFSLYKDSRIPQAEFEMVYPIMALDKFGKEYRFHLMQVLSWAGGESVAGGNTKRTTIFPFFFKQTSPDPQKNYTAVMPFYGRLQNRLFRDEVFFVMLPLYLQTVKRGVTTYNYLFPFFHWRQGAGVKGWQFWPLVGHERKAVTTSTNNWGDLITSGGHEKFFALWPLFFKNTLGIGTTNVQRQLVALPFYSSQVASNRISKTYGFPIGYTHTIDHDGRYEEHDLPWPLVVFARGPGKTVNRIWPFFSQGKSPTLQSDFYAWPIYKYNRITSDPLDRERTRILLFLYSDTRERNTTNNTALLRRDFWPFYTWRKDHQNNERLQVLSILEPILPGNKSVERLYSPTYSVWRQEKNGKNGDSSKSLLWNLYREEKRADYKKQVALFGLFQREKSADRTRWRIFFVRFSKTPPR
jgi:hypothetical protein